MTKKEHIQYWLNQIPEDIDVVMILFNTKHYAHSLFWAHLVLEKLLNRNSSLEILMNYLMIENE